ncbi:leucine-rich repeat flightless-interacting protein 1 isoform X9 [Sorex araneus]|uniref:leucine-rich repeat flightless-interacting protein 1 isoform X9 n=1 Tax=Sorex araneus TaxID=42254 RepID=UPI0024339DBE|nr:leucine-rich repeat flightless-interacting protein 1 isoform X9 [Sorex araneus]
MDMGTQGAGRKRLPNRERLTAEDDALNQIAREAEARLAAKRAARAEAREIRMKELERQQKEIYQVQKKYYGLDARWGDIEQWMEDSERCSAWSRRHPSGPSGSVSLSSGGLASQALPTQNGSWGTPWGESSVLDGPRRASVCVPLAPSEHGLNSSSRASSRASSARASPVVEERPEKEFAEKASRNLPGLSAATLASLGGGASRRNSGDTCTSVDTEASVREMRDSLLEAEEKYKKAMVSNAQLDNEKTNFMYQVDTLKDMLLELEEQLAESQRQCEEKSKELEREKHAHSVLQFQFAEVKEALKQREEMLEALERQKEFFDSVRSERDDLREEVVKLKEGLKKHGIILNSETATNGETSCKLADAVHPSLASASREGFSALPATGDGAPGSASEVPWTRGSVAQVGQTEISPRTERDPPAEAPGEAGAATEAAHPRGESGQSQRVPEERAPVPKSLPECSGQAGEPRQSPPGAEEPGCGEPASPRPSSPLKSSSDQVDPEGGQPAGATEEQSPGMQEPTQGAQVGGGGHEEEDEGRGQGGEKPIHTRPGAPVAAPSTGEANSDPPETKETDKEMQGPPGEAADSSQKKAKNKKKKNKKKRAPAPADSGHNAEEDTASQTSDLGAVKGEEPVEGAKQKPEAQAQDNGPHTPPPEVAARGGENPEHSRTEWGVEQQQEDEAGSALATPGSVEGVPGTAEGSAPQEEEEGPSEDSLGSPLGSPSSPHSRAGGDTEQAGAEDGDPAPAGEPENSEDARGSSARGRGKEECSLS